MKPGEKAAGEKDEADEDENDERLRSTGPPATASRSSSSSSRWSPSASISRRRSRSRSFPKSISRASLVGVDNGVAPIDQMQVTVTRPIEEAVNSVQGLERVQSITSRGTAEIDLFFSWKVDMFQTLQRVNAALARVQPELPPTAKVTANRLTFAAFPIMGYSLTSDTVPQTRLWELATYDLKPRLNRMTRRVDDRRAGRPGAGVRGQARSREAAADADHRPEPARRDRPQQPDRLARPVREQPPAGAEPGQRPGAIARGHRQHRREDDAARRADPDRRHRRRSRRRSSRSTRRHRERASRRCC